MNDSQLIMQQLNLSGQRLSKGHRKIASFIDDHYDKVVFMTAARLGGVVEVSESTVVRFANACGYEGYPQMQRALKEIVRHRLTPSQRLTMSSDISSADLPAEVLRTDMQNIRATIEQLNADVFGQVVEQISKAKSIYLIGLRSASPLAQFFAYYLRYIFDDVRVVNSIINDTFETIARIKPGDVLIAISFPRYSNRTLECMQFAKTHNVDVIGITDGPLSPMHDVSDLCLDARTDMTSFADSLAAPMSLINALIAALGRHNRETLNRNFNQMEDVWDAFRIYAGKV
ncbi:MAG: MurR/RpiR family transcriptional regulator [Clostridiales bacterium]|nr:MurR/RpiR family transcriptional regulator [Clostridiales bacterium]